MQILMSVLRGFPNASKFALTDLLGTSASVVMDTTDWTTDSSANVSVYDISEREPIQMC